MDMTDIETRSKRIREKQKELRNKFTDEEYIERLENALLVVEYIAMHQEDLPKHINTEKEKELHDAINKVYRLSHVARLPGCIAKHEDWEDELQEMKELI